LLDRLINQSKAFVLDAALKDIERSNNITRYSLWCQWNNPNQPLPPGVRFPKTWPLDLRERIEFLSRPISKEDVLGLVAQRCPNAINILVTKDPGATLGWTEIDSFFVQD